MTPPGGTRREMGGEIEAPRTLVADSIKPRETARASPDAAAVDPGRPASDPLIRETISSKTNFHS